jgi:hypothetical protein
MVDVEENVARLAELRSTHRASAKADAYESSTTGVGTGF